MKSNCTFANIIYPFHSKFAIFVFMWALFFHPAQGTVGVPTWCGRQGYLNPCTWRWSAWGLRRSIGRGLSRRCRSNWKRSMPWWYIDRSPASQLPILRSWMFIHPTLLIAQTPGSPLKIRRRCWRELVRNGSRHVNKLKAVHSAWPFVTVLSGKEIEVEQSPISHLALPSSIRKYPKAGCICGGTIEALGMICFESIPPSIYVLRPSYTACFSLRIQKLTQTLLFFWIFYLDLSNRILEWAVRVRQIARCETATW